MALRAACTPDDPDDLARACLPSRLRYILPQTVNLTSFIPDGLPGPEHFTIAESAAPTADDLQDGDLLLQALVMR